ncbi:MAG: metallophosphoesterase [Spirochaetes bacterium]|nr:metallophosphoesterase [Spirochaetota bacterium]
MIILAFFNCFILSLETYGLYIEPFKVEVSNLKIATKKLKLDRPIKIAQISDLHIERTTKRELRVLNKIKEINPDIIVLTGDYLNISFTHDPQTLIQTREFLMNLKAPFGVYAVTSDIVDPDETVDILFSGLNIEVLEDKIYPVKIYGNIIYIIGVSNIDSLLDKLTLLSLVNKLPDESYKLFLYHTPDLIEAAAASKIDLYLAGHTHGGQIRLPFYGALITCSTFKKKYEQGLFEILDTKMYVSRGLGMEGQGAPRVRFLCPPEIAIFDIKSE